MKVNDKITVFNNTGEFLCNILEINNKKKYCTCVVLEQVKKPCNKDFYLVIRFCYSNNKTR